MNRDNPINDRIRAKSIRLVDEEGKQIGVMSLREALDRAYRENLDLLQVSVAEVPVCRITDAGKFFFERKKAQKEQAKRQRELAIETKEIQLRPCTDSNDVQVKARRAIEFLREGNKVKIVVRFRGREHAHRQEGHKIVAEFLDLVKDYRIDRPTNDTGKDLQLIIASTKNKSDIVRTKDLLIK